MFCYNYILEWVCVRGNLEGWKGVFVSFVVVVVVVFMCGFVSVG